MPPREMDVNARLIEMRVEYVSIVGKAHGRWPAAGHYLVGHTLPVPGGLGPGKHHGCVGMTLVGWIKRSGSTKLH